MSIVRKIYKNQGMNQNRSINHTSTWKIVLGPDIDRASWKSDGWELYILLYCRQESVMHISPSCSFVCRGSWFVVKFLPKQCTSMCVIDFCCWEWWMINNLFVTITEKSASILLRWYKTWLLNKSNLVLFLSYCNIIYIALSIL